MIRIGDADFSLEIDNSHSPARCSINSPHMQVALDVDLGERKELCDFIEKFKSGKHWFGYPSWTSSDGKLMLEKSDKNVMTVTVLPQSPEPSIWTMTAMIEITPDDAQKILEEV
ncbi:MAG: hypothetical protein ACOC2L_05375 [Candidatus Sumerlaeota bacterium]